MRGLPGHPIRSGTPVREPRRLPDHLPDRLPDRLPHDEEGSAEISYVWTVFLSSMILTSVMISLTQAVDSTDVAHGQAEVDEVAARVVYGINTVLELSRKYPEVAHEQRSTSPRAASPSWSWASRTASWSARRGITVPASKWKYITSKVV